MNFLEIDTSNSIIKFNPLINWNLKEIENYINLNSIPYISLYKKGFKSIGCLPCTRAINDTDDIRSGRWWWENSKNKECGLHN